MLHTKDIQALLFDFGGTIDTGGLHWLHVLYPLWEQRLPGLDPGLYRQAFARGERRLAMEKIILPTDNFLHLLEKKLSIQAAFLQENAVACTIGDQQAVARRAYQQARDHCTQHRLIIERLQQKYRIAMVSNFYGNLQTVLRDFGIMDLFETLTESAVAGVKKPDPQIWQLGCDSLSLAAENCVAIGDSLTKDMQPATHIGCQGIWLQGRGWEDELRTRANESASASANETAVVVETETTPAGNTNANITAKPHSTTINYQPITSLQQLPELLCL